MRQIIQSSWRPIGGAIRTTRLGAQPLETKVSACRYSVGWPAETDTKISRAPARAAAWATRTNPLIPALPGTAVSIGARWSTTSEASASRCSYRVVERRADKVDVGMQVVVWVGGDSGDPMPSGDQLPGHGTPKQSGDAGQKDPHA